MLSLTFRGHKFNYSKSVIRKSFLSFSNDRFEFIRMCSLYQYRIISTSHNINLYQHLTTSPPQHLTTSTLHLLAVNIHMIDIDVFVEEDACCFAEAFFAFCGEIAACATFCELLLHLGMTVEVVGKRVGYVGALRHYAHSVWNVLHN